MDDYKNNSYNSSVNNNKGNKLNKIDLYVSEETIDFLYDHLAEKDYFYSWHNKIKSYITHMREYTTPNCLRNKVQKNCIQNIVYNNFQNLDQRSTSVFTRILDPQFFSRYELYTYEGIDFVNKSARLWNIKPDWMYRILAAMRGIIPENCFTIFPISNREIPEFDQNKKYMDAIFQSILLSIISFTTILSRMNYTIIIMHYFKKFLYTKQIISIYICLHQEEKMITVLNILILVMFLL